MDWVMRLGLLAGCVWATTLVWGAFPSARVEYVRGWASAVLLLAALAGLIHALWVTSP